MTTCKECLKKRKGLTWIGEPPTCNKHKKRRRSIKVLIGIIISK